MVSFAGTVACASAACGPAVEIEGDTDGSSDSQSGSDTIIDPSESETGSTTTPPQGCNHDDDCPTGFSCEDQQCVEDDYDCYDYGDCYCYYGHCSPPNYYDCYGDEDCGSGELCDFDYCDAVQNLPNCGGPVELLGTPIPIPDAADIQSLAFVDLDDAVPGEALVVGEGTGGWVLRSGQEPLALPDLGAAIQDAIADDLDGDAAVDLALVSDAGLTVLYGFGGEAQERVDVAGSLDALESFGPLEAPPSLAVRQGDQLFTVEGLTTRAPTLQLLEAPVSPVSLAPFAFSDSWNGFVADGGTLGPSLIVTATDAQEYLGEPARASGRTMASGQLGGEARSDVLWATPYADWTYLEVSVDGAPPERRALYFTYPDYGIGDLDGNGFGDAIGVGPGGVVVLPGDETWGVSCFVQGPLEGTPGPMDVGDFDGDGTDELALIPGEATGAIVYDVSWEP